MRTATKAATPASKTAAMAAVAAATWLPTTILVWKLLLPMMPIRVMPPMILLQHRQQPVPLRPEVRMKTPLAIVVLPALRQRLYPLLAQALLSGLLLQRVLLAEVALGELLLHLQQERLPMQRRQAHLALPPMLPPKLVHRMPSLRPRKRRNQRAVAVNHHQQQKEEQARVVEKHRNCHRQLLVKLVSTQEWRKEMQKESPQQEPAPQSREEQATWHKKARALLPLHLLPHRRRRRL